MCIMINDMPITLLQEKIEFKYHGAFGHAIEIIPFQIVSNSDAGYEKERK